MEEMIEGEEFIVKVHLAINMIIAIRPRKFYY